MFEKNTLSVRMATMNDVDLYYRWATDPAVRAQSFNQHQVSYDEHVSWFTTKLVEPYCRLYVFESVEGKPVGQCRFQLKADEYVISVNMDADYRGKKMATDMIKLACSEYLKEFPDLSITAYIKEKNIASQKAFLRAGFKIADRMLIGEEEVQRMKYKNQ